MKAFNILFCILVILIYFLVGNGYAIERHLLLFVPFVEGKETVVLEVLPNGEIRNTYQRMTTGYGSNYPGVSPDQQNILIPAANTTTQYRISPTGLVSRLTTYEHIGRNGWSANYHPNGKMVIFATNSIYSVRNDGLLEWINPAPSCDPRWINPCRNMLVEGGSGKTMNFQSIDTVAMTVTTSQNIDIRGDFHDAAFTPDGNQVLICKTPAVGEISDIDIFSILPDDTLDTTAQHIDIPNAASAYSIIMSPDGQYAYIAIFGRDSVVTISHDSAGVWFDTGKRLILYGPWRIVCAPVNNMVVVDHQIDVLGYSYTYLSTFYMQPDGELLPTGYSFPFQQTFGDNPLTFVFAYPPGITEVESDQWQLYE
jgi:DNA-binding beta-propeller fold protein YncE